MGNGLMRVLKQCGRLQVSANGQTVTHEWDYKNNCPVVSKIATTEKPKKKKKERIEPLKILNLFDEKEG